jgi:hypothetical protein
MTYCRWWYTSNNGRKCIKIKKIRIAYLEVYRVV